MTWGHLLFFMHGSLLIRNASYFVLSLHQTPKTKPYSGEILHVTVIKWRSSCLSGLGFTSSPKCSIRMQISPCVDASDKMFQNLVTFNFMMLTLKTPAQPSDAGFVPIQQKYI